MATEKPTPSLSPGTPLEEEVSTLLHSIYLHDDHPDAVLPIMMRIIEREQMGQGSCTCVKARAEINEVVPGAGDELAYSLGCPVHDPVAIENARRAKLVEEQRTSNPTLLDKVLMLLMGTYEDDTMMDPSEWDNWPKRLDEDQRIALAALFGGPDYRTAKEKDK